jgi:hypothetical protein
MPPGAVFASVGHENNETMPSSVNFSNSIRQLLALFHRFPLPTDATTALASRLCINLIPAAGETYRIALR